MKKIVSFTIILLAACNGSDGDDPTDTCGAAGYSALIGAQLAAVTLPADLNARILQPNTAATTDYIEDRLNITVDEGGIITGLSCG